MLDGHKTVIMGEALKDSIGDEQMIVFIDQSTSCLYVAEYVELHISE